MAKYTQATGNALTKKAYQAKLFEEMMKESYFSRFHGSIVDVKEDLTKSKGDVVNFGLRMRMTATGQTGLSTLEGNEESLTIHADSVTIDQYRHAVRYEAYLSEQRASFMLSENAEAALKMWASEKIDQLHFDALDSPDTATIAYTTSGATNPSYHSTAATALAAVGSTDTLRYEVLTKVKPFLKTGNSRAQAPVRPVRIDGKDYYVVLQHPNALVDLKLNSTYQQFVREAEVRGSQNPIFQGSVAVIDGFIIHEHENVPLGTGSGSASVSKGYILGESSLCWAWAKKPEFIRKSFDYDGEVGEAVRWMSGAVAPVFNSKPYGFIGYYVGTASNYAGASIS
jgi:N4-gp56 family major capsid protein